MCLSLGSHQLMCRILAREKGLFLPGILLQDLFCQLLGDIPYCFRRFCSALRIETKPSTVERQALDPAERVDTKRLFSLHCFAIALVLRRLKVPRSGVRLKRHFNLGVPTTFQFSRGWGVTSGRSSFGRKVKGD